MEGRWINIPISRNRRMSVNHSCVWRGSLAVLHGEEAMQGSHLQLTFGETSVCLSLCAHLAGEKFQEDSTTHLLVRTLMGFESTFSENMGLIPLPKLQGTGLNVRWECFCILCLCLKGSNPSPGTSQNWDCAKVLPRREAQRHSHNT